MCFEYQSIKFQWKKRSKFSHLLTVRAEVAGPPPLTVSLTVKYLFFLTPRLIDENHIFNLINTSIIRSVYSKHENVLIDILGSGHPSLAAIRFLTKTLWEWGLPRLIFLLQKSWSRSLSKPKSCPLICQIGKRVKILENFFEVLTERKLYHHTQIFFRHFFFNYGCLGFHFFRLLYKSL